MVFYDRCFAEKFGNMSETRVRAVIAIADEMFSERDSLQTIIDISDDFPIVPKLQSNWRDKDWDKIFDTELGMIARDSKFEANLYVFLTVDKFENTTNPGKATGYGNACDTDRRYRMNIVKYRDRSWRGGDADTGAVGMQK